MTCCCSSVRGVRQRDGLDNCRSPGGIPAEKEVPLFFLVRQRGEEASGQLDERRCPESQIQMPRACLLEMTTGGLAGHAVGSRDLIPSQFDNGALPHNWSCVDCPSSWCGYRMVISPTGKLAGEEFRSELEPNPVDRFQRLDLQ